VVPQVNTVEEAQHVVSSSKFGSDVRGTRSAPPFRLLPGLSDTPLDPSKSIHKNTNDQAVVMIQIETLEGVNNLDDILTQVPDIDSVWLGTFDLQVSMGLNPTMQSREQKDPAYQEAVAKYKRICAKHNIPKGGFALGSPEDVKAAAGDNVFIVVGSDVLGILGQAAMLQQAKELLPPRIQTGSD
jgi:4-hydroxy-2-oxoheptanedioate aldolase